MPAFGLVFALPLPLARPERRLVEFIYQAKTNCSELKLFNSDVSIRAPSGAGRPPSAVRAHGAQQFKHKASGESERPGGRATPTAG